MLNERLSKLTAFGILERVELDAKRQHVAYRFTAQGDSFTRVLDAIDALQVELNVLPSTSADGLQALG